MGQGVDRGQIKLIPQTRPERPMTRHGEQHVERRPISTLMSMEERTDIDLAAPRFRTKQTKFRRFHMKEKDTVPPEFKGMARAFLQRHKPDPLAYLRTLSAIRQQVGKRFDKHLPLRRETLRDIDRQLRETNPVSHSCDWIRDNEEVRIADCFFYVGRTQLHDWGITPVNRPDELKVGANAEATFDFAQGIIQADRRSFQTLEQPMVALGFHCLGRRYQRGFRCDDEAILADVRCLAEQWQRWFTTGRTDETRFDTPSGAYFGRLAVNRFAGEGEKPFLSMRTFYN
jgi:hypothetical protein